MRYSLRIMMGGRHGVFGFVFLALGLGACSSTDNGAAKLGAGSDASGTGGASSTGGSGSSNGGAAGHGAGGAGVGGKVGGSGGKGSGGAVGSGNPMDASSGPGCAGHWYKLCEDWESATDGKLPAGWSKVDGWNSGDALVTSAEHHGGQKALASSIAVNGQPRAGHSLSSLGATAGTHWGRIFYKVKTPAPLPNGGVIHNTMVGLRGSSESRVVDTVVNTQGAHQFLYNLPDDSCCGGSDYDYHSYDGKWHCAEWHIDAATQSFHFYFEGTEVTSIGFDNHPGNAARIEQFSSIAVGWINYQSPDPPYEAWFDDLAIDDTRIGCD